MMRMVIHQSLFGFALLIASTTPVLAQSGKTRGHMLADVVTTIGTQDIVFGEIDR